MRQLSALFIGRFQPFHKGHLDVVRQVLRLYPKIIIGIGSAQYSGMPKNPFSAAQRIRMIRGSLRAANISTRKFALVKISDIHNDNRWVKHVEKLAPQFGDVWSGTKKVQKLFRKDGKHKTVRPKFNLNISGTKIRALMKTKKKWQHLVPSAVENLCK
ncbi:nicotinamide-nucleotide adenylyltransferase [Candidatus Peregrinibacteria bacterium]|nr:nicotinamide-nucleotide adenylyltransferase [Candidatus Peregrinibacteria bacterium]